MLVDFRPAAAKVGSAGSVMRYTATTEGEQRSNPSPNAVPRAPDFIGGRHAFIFHRANGLGIRACGVFEVCFYLIGRVGA